MNSNSWFEGEVLVVEDSYIYCPFLYATYRFLMDFPVFFGLAFFLDVCQGFMWSQVSLVDVTSKINKLNGFSNELIYEEGI